MRWRCNSLRTEYLVCTPLIPAIATLRTSLNQTLVGTMGPIQFVYLAILAAVAGVIAVPINEVRIDSKFCNPSFIRCPVPPKLVDGCWVCKFTED
ncbi:hypothetical protein EDD22DRAFT_192968 [Suillus occidentalis]|nr:hypothetical protein EDD22DRAFT_192968 [Suillus occidentalis]